MKNPATQYKCFVLIGDNLELSRLIQEKCFEAGITWSFSRNKIISTNHFGEQYCISVNYNGIGCNILNHCDKEYFVQRGIKELSVPEFFNYLRHYNDEPLPAPIKLIGGLSAKFNVDNKTVSIGGLSFTFFEALEIANVIKKYQEENK